MNKKEIELKINDIVLKCSFGLGFLGELLENLDLSVFDIGEKLDKNPFKWIPVLMYESAKYTNEDLDLTKDELINLLDSEDGGKAMSEFLGAFVNSLSKDVPKQENVKNTKKATPKKK